MQLVIPGLVDLPRTDFLGVATYEVVPGAKLDVHPLVPLPAELETWGRDVVGAGYPPERIRVIAVSEQTTDLGWPVTIAGSELRDESGTVVELRVHMLFRFLEVGGIAILRATSTSAFDQALEFIKPLIAATRPDFHGDAVPAIALVWSGL